jgi:hypothetical protein
MGGVAVVTGLATNVHISPGNQIYVGVTPLMVLGVVLIALAVPMRWRAVVRSRQTGPDLPPQPPPLDPMS